MVCIVALALLDSQTYLVQKDKCLDRRYQKVIVWKNQTRGVLSTGWLLEITKCTLVSHVLVGCIGQTGRKIK